MQPIAGSLAEIAGRELNPNELAAAMIRRLRELSEQMLSGRTAWMREYRSACVTLGKQVLLVRGEEKRPAFALDVDEEGGLVARYEDGSIATVSSGEASVRGLDQK